MSELAARLCHVDPSNELAWVYYPHRLGEKKRHQVGVLGPISRGRFARDPSTLVSISCAHFRLLVSCRVLCFATLKTLGFFRPAAFDVSLLGF